MKISGYIISCLALLMLQSCLFDNDMSYPRVYANVTAFAVEGQESCTINTDTRTVSIVLEETAYINSLKVTSSSISEEARCDDFPKVDDVIDLTEPRKYTLSTYQDYEWTISATQPIERYIRCDNQGSTPIINGDMHAALVYVVETQSLQNVTITDMKLEREGSEIYLVTDGVAASEECEFPMENVDVQTGLEFEVRYDDVRVRWKVSFEQEIVPIEITMANAWTYHVDIEATYGRVGTPYIEYRKADSDEWIRFDEVSLDGINIYASVPGDGTETGNRLEPGTDYEFKVCTETSESDVITVKTGTPDQIENMDFEDWWSSESISHRIIWYPNLNETVKIWDSANPGSGLFIGSLTTPYETVPEASEGRYAARLESKNAIVAFAAGNIITGEFKGINGRGAKMNWGTPFTARPRALEGYYSYKPVKIDWAEGECQDLLNSMDQCQILVFLTDWTEPFLVNTTDNVFVDQTPDNESIIAYGKMESDKDTFADPSADANGYLRFSVELDYWRPDATPTYAVVIACASYKGDYFTGGVGSVMCVDDLEFVYD